MIPETLCCLDRPTNWQNSRSSFFKFTTSSTAEIVLRNRTLRWSTPAHLNDPHDNQFDFSTRLDRPLAKQLTLTKLWDSHYGDGPIDPTNQLGLLIASLRGRFPTLSREEFYAEFAPAIDETFDRIEVSVARFNREMGEFASTNKILCFTENVENTLMWAHYAENHTGVAIRFRSIPELDSVFGAARPVQYVEAPPKLYDVEVFSDVMSGRASLDRKAILSQVALTKSTSWAHEKEWRVFGGFGRDKEASYEDLPFNTLEVDAVVLGCKIEASRRILLTQVVTRQYPHAQIFQSNMRRGDFGFSFESQR